MGNTDLPAGGGGGGGRTGGVLFEVVLSQGQGLGQIRHNKPYVFMETITSNTVLLVHKSFFSLRDFKSIPIE